MLGALCGVGVSFGLGVRGDALSGFYALPELWLVLALCGVLLAGSWWRPEFF